MAIMKSSPFDNRILDLKDFIAVIRSLDHTSLLLERKRAANQMINTGSLRSWNCLHYEGTPFADFTPDL